MTTVNLTKVDGGVQLNVIPAEFNAYFDIRIPPTEDFDAFEAQIDSWCKKAGKDVKYEFLQVRIFTNFYFFLAEQNQEYDSNNKGRSVVECLFVGFGRDVSFYYY